MAIFIIDRYLQVEGLTLKRNRFQLIGVSAMFIASKVSDILFVALFQLDSLWISSSILVS